MYNANLDRNITVKMSSLLFSKQTFPNIHIWNIFQTSWETPVCFMLKQHISNLDLIVAYTSNKDYLSSFMNKYLKKNTSLTFQLLKHSGTGWFSNLLCVMLVLEATPIQNNNKKCTARSDLKTELPLWTKLWCHLTISCCVLSQESQKIVYCKYHLI